MKLLIKQAFNIIFSSKIFSFILMGIIFISSLTYTLLQSSTNAFQNSYNNLIDNGQLHDFVAKELYNNEGYFDLIYKKTNIENEYLIKINEDEESRKPIGDYEKYFAANPNEKEHKVRLIPKATIYVDELDADLDSQLQNAIIERKEYLEKIVNLQKRKSFQDTITEIYSNELTVGHTQSLSVAIDKNVFKFVKKNNNQSINKLVIYDGVSKFTNFLSDQQMGNQLDKLIEKEGNPPKSWYIINKTKGFRWTAQAFSKVISLTDPSSFQAIVSPSYANLNNKRAITPQEVLKLYKDNNYFQDETDITKLKTQYEDNLIWVDKTPYFIIGVGTTPDFAFPIIDQIHPIPIPQDEAVIYTNVRGYERIYDAFRNSASENYFSFKYQKGLEVNRKKDIMIEVEDIARNGKDSQFVQKFFASKEKSESKKSELNLFLPPMSWPANIPIVTEYNDTNDGVILTGQRIAFLHNLKETINILTITTTSFLIIFVSSIVLLVFKSLLAIRRIKNATLMAIGYSKKAIATSISLIAIALIGIPSVFGYVFGYFLQYPFINIFAQYWTIPTYGSAFSIISLIITVIIPITLIFVLVFILINQDLNEKITNMLRGKSKYKFSLVQIILKPFLWINIKAKYIISLTIANIGRLILATLAGVISVSAIMVGISSIGRAEYAYNQTTYGSSYTYQANFSSPTFEGGQYKSITYSDALDLLNKEQQNQDDIHWHIPSMKDGPFTHPMLMGNLDFGESLYRTFLKNKLQFKPFLDLSISDINSWDIAKKLMPDNQKNTAESNEKQFYELAVNTPKNQVFKAELDRSNKVIKWWPKKENNWNILPKTKMENDSINPDFIKFVKNGLLDLKNDKSSNFIPYIISYGVIITNDNSDEKYTYINTKINYKDYSIIGLDPKTNYFKFNSETREKLINYHDQDSYPLIINQYIAEKHNLNVGLSLSLSVDNHVERNIDKTQRFINFKVIDIIDTYDDNRFLTRQEDANKIIGLDNLYSKQQKNDQVANFSEANNLTENDKPFNGLFTKQKHPVALKTLSLYSPSNFYIASDSITSDWRKIVVKIMEKLGPDSYLKHIIKDNDYEKATQLFIQTYSITPYLGMFDNIVVRDITNQTFKSISKMAANIIIIIQVISIILSILFAIIVSSLLITSNSKKIATLWTLGYRRSEVMRMFSMIYLLPIIFSFAISIPISIGALAFLRVFVINFGSILIPFALVWWAIILALLFIGTIFIASTIIGIMKIKNAKARETIQEE